MQSLEATFLVVSVESRFLEVYVWKSFFGSRSFRKSTEKRRNLLSTVITMQNTEINRQTKQVGIAKQANQTSELNRTKQND